MKGGQRVGARAFHSESPVIPREGVESGLQLSEYRVGVLDDVIPREGVERFTIFNRFELVDHDSDPERGS